MAAIETQDLSRTFAGGINAVGQVSLAVEEGEIFAFLGPNGAGKTTTVRMLVTLLRPTSGSARVAGFDVVTQANSVRRNVGVALQEAALDPLMTGRELVSLQATLYDLPRDASRDGALLEELGLTEAADRRVSTYSGGMRRRLDLALALVHEPRVLFLDEPTTGLDPPSRRSIWQRVRELRDRGTAVFLTTQYLEEADQLADRVSIIDHGRIVAAGTPERLKAEVGRARIVITLAREPNGRRSPSGSVRLSSARPAKRPRTRLSSWLAQSRPASAEATDPIPVDRVLAQFGKTCRTNDREFSVALGNGTNDIAPVVRALDEAGIPLQSFELVRPTLDDVFIAKTGRRLEGARGSGAEPE
jgi:ABC-2 type transport system ATP-binding protein